MILSLFQRKFLWKGREERNFVSKIWIIFFSYPRDFQLRSKIHLALDGSKKPCCEIILCLEEDDAN